MKRFVRIGRSWVDPQHVTHIESRSNDVIVLTTSGSCICVDCDDPTFTAEKIARKLSSMAETADEVPE